MTIPNSIIELVERFTAGSEEFLSHSYKELRLRVDFIDPFFKALGWDIPNEARRAELYREVVYEDTVKIGNAPKAPDYSFRLGGERKFFVETKQPSTKLQASRASAFQLRRYAWSANLPLSILTNFREFAVYNGRIEPKEHDEILVGRILYLTYDQYASEWDKIENIFSRSAVMNGAYDEYAWTLQEAKGSRRVDEAFLKEIEKWRETLAKDIASRNQLATSELNDAVQRTIDRIVFLRICEDRGIEGYGQLQSLLNNVHVYKQLCNLYTYADQRYNSGLFHFEKDSRPSPIDNWTLQLSVGDEALSRVIRSLYYPQSPYEFSVMPADILGQVYEQFLGKVIQQSPAGASVVEKPEVKKAGGVYYTPTYIVDYIVKHTIGKQLEGLTPEQVSDLCIIDPSCGSGSFLINVYGYLLNWHLEWYLTKGSKKYAKRMYQTTGGLWRLTSAEKKRILLNNIYGVDIDSQAVEVTKLSLLLKVLEGESAQSVEDNLRLFHERALPDLASNIKWGNTLISPNFYDTEAAQNLDVEQLRRVNAFNWETEFPEIMRAGGFDAVVGNPPYIGFHGFMADKEYLKNAYISAKGKFDYYLPFIERGLGLLKDKGLLGFICPTNFTKRGHGQALRDYLKGSIRILQICDFQDVQIFSGALNYTGIFIFEKTIPTNEDMFSYKQRSLQDNGFNVKQSELGSDAWIIRESGKGDIVEKVSNQNVSPLKDITSGISEGIVTGKNEVFLLSIEEVLNLKLEVEIIRPCLRGREIRRYKVEKPNEAVIYPYKLVGKKTRSLTEEELKKFPHVFNYLESRRADLAGRPYFEKSTKQWFELWCQRDLQLLSSPKIVVPELSDSNRFALGDPNIFYGDTVCGITLSPETEESILYILGVLNSKLIEFYYKQTTVPKANQFYIYKTMFLKNIPIRRIDFSNSSDRTLHDEIVRLVSEMISLNEKLTQVKTEGDNALFQRKLTHTDSQLDRVVISLYGLTENDVETIEKPSPPPPSGS